MKKASSVGDISLSPWNDLEVFKQWKKENEMKVKMEELNISSENRVAKKSVVTLGLNPIPRGLKYNLFHARGGIYAPP